MERRQAGQPKRSLAVQSWGETYFFARSLNVAPEPIPAGFNGDIAFTPDRANLFGVSPDEWIHSWSVADKRVARFWKDNADFWSGRCGMNGLVIGSRWVVIAESDGYLKYLADRQVHQKKVLGKGNEKLVGVALDPTETFVASGSQLGGVNIYRLPSGRKVAHPKAHRDSVEALDFAPDGRTLVTGSLDGSIRLWKSGSDGQWTESLTIATALGPVQRVRFNPDVRLLAVVIRNESAVHIWDLGVLADRLAALGLGF